MSKEVKIPMEMLIDMHALVMLLKDYSLDDQARELCNSIEGQILWKHQSMERRAAYSEYKNGKTEEIRNAARQRYLELGAGQWNGDASFTKRY